MSTVPCVPCVPCAVAQGTPWLGAAEAAEDLVQAAEAGGGASVQAARLAELGARSVRRCFEARREITSVGC